MKIGTIQRDSTHHNQADDRNNSHKDTGILSKSERVDLHEWLWCIEGKHGVEVWCAEQKQNGCDEAQNTCCNCAQ